MSLKLVFHRPTLSSAQSSLPNSSIKTVPQLIDFHARENPEYVFCMQSNSSGDEGQPDFQRVTYSALEKAILACQTSILSMLGRVDRPKRDEQGNVIKRAPVALLMESDLSILLYMFSLFGLGIPVLLVSIRLSPLAIKSLIVESGVSMIYTSPRYELHAKEALDLLEEEQVKLELNLRLSYKKFIASHTEGSRSRVYTDWHYMGHDDRNVLILHSSGTTGLPKAIPQSHEYILNYATCHELSHAEGQGLNLTTLPLFHGFGLLAPLLCMSVGKTFIIPSSALHTGAQVSIILKQFNFGSLMTVPAILQGLIELNDPETIKALQNLDFVACGGGALKESVGKHLAAVGVKIVNSYGNTEAGPLSVMYVPSSVHDWRWFTLRRDMKVNIVQGYESSGLHPENRTRLSIQPPGWSRVFEMEDMFIMNPNAAKEQFRPLERTDDVIVLNTGEKVSPYILENVLSELDDVRAVLVFGHGQSQLGVLVEPRVPLEPEALNTLTGLILITLLEAENLTDAHARIVSRDAIVILKPGQSLPRSDKGATLRRDSYEAYSEEIEHAYKLLGSTSLGEGNSILKGDVEENLTQLIRTRILRPGQLTELTASTDLFELGMDSLQATQLRQILFSTLVGEIRDRETAAKIVSREFVYVNSTITKMTTRLSGRFDSPAADSREEAIQHYVQEYSNRTLIDTSIHPSGAVVLLTGASGGLGCHILAQLARKDTVIQIICLNRAAPSYLDPYIRQYKCSREKGADIPKHLLTKIEVFDVNTSLPHLGLSEAIYHRLTSTVTHIVHSAWPMDFNRQLQSFRQQFEVMSNLIQFSLDAKEKYPHGTDANPILVRLLFVSSISVVGNYKNDGTERDSVIAPEKIARNAKHTLPLGYAEAKLVCEMMLDNAIQAGKVKGVITRMGQISGAIQNGYWNTSEHFPILLKNSVKIGALPQLQGTLSWIPLEIAARTVTDVLLAAAEANADPVYHIENPQRQQWNTILAELSQNLSIPLIPYHDWMKLLRGRTIVDLSDIYSEKFGGDQSQQLAEFFEGLFERMSCGSIVLDTENTRRMSPAFQTTGLFRQNLLKKYLEYWRGCGFLSKL